MMAGLQKWTVHIVMSENSERFIFKQEITRLSSDYERCQDPKTKKEISAHINLLKEAIELLAK